MSNVLITGATGMVGKGILLECIRDPRINSIVLLSRSAVDIKSPKVKEVFLRDFNEIEIVKNELGKIDACFHCMGVSSMGMNEEQYLYYTYEITKKLVDVCFDINPQMTFNYVSGDGTDSSEKGKVMWARVKGKTENYILSKGFSKAFMFRPGLILPENGIKSRVRLYNLVYIILRPFFSRLRKNNKITTTSRIGQAMVNSLELSTKELVHFQSENINELAGVKF